MSEEFVLSEKIRTDRSYNEVDVKEFIKKLKEHLHPLPESLCTCCSVTTHWINRLAGDKLVEEKK